MEEIQLEFQEWMTDRIDSQGEVYVEYSAILPFPKQWNEEIESKIKDLKAADIIMSLEEFNGNERQLTFEVSGYREPTEKELKEEEENHKKRLETTLRAAIRQDPSLAANILQEYL